VLKSRLLPVDLCEWNLTNFRFPPLKIFVINFPFIEVLSKSVLRNDGWQTCTVRYIIKHCKEEQHMINI